MWALRRLVALPARVAARSCSGPSGGTSEAQLEELLRARFPGATTVQVQDISGGCGAMYEIWVEAADFGGLSRVKQHRLVTQALAEQIKDMHGLRISTSVPES